MWSPLGWCDKCQEFAGLCAVGRVLRQRGTLAAVDWAVKCPVRGTEVWHVTTDGKVHRALLCRRHGDLMQAGQAPPGMNGGYAGPPPVPRRRRPRLARRRDGDR